MLIRQSDTLDELHLTPINTAIQLRPSLFYIDKITEKQNKRHEEDTLEANKRANPEYEEEAKVLSVCYIVGLHLQYAVQPIPPTVGHHQGPRGQRSYSKGSARGTKTEGRRRSMAAALNSPYMGTDTIPPIFLAPEPHKTFAL